MNHKSDIKDEVHNDAVKTGEEIASIKHKLNDLKDKVLNFQAQASDYVKDGYVKAKGKTSEIESKVTAYTRENPLKTIGIAVVVGAVVAKLLRSRK